MTKLVHKAGSMQRVEVTEWVWEIQGKVCGSLPVEAGITRLTERGGMSHQGAGQRGEDGKED